MTTALRVLFALAAFVGTVAHAAADCRAVRVVNHHRDVVVVDTVLATTFVPLAVAVPAYSVGYSQQGGDLEAIKQELARLRAELAARPAASTPAAAASAPHLAVFVNNCASCHDKKTASKGGDFAFLEGGQLVAQLDTLQLGKMAAYIAAHEMPRGRKMSEPDQRIAQKWIADTLRSVKAEK